jgi:lysophospholipid acyltransferase (LPLAT)-like uncharacterized protein
MKIRHPLILKWIGFLGAWLIRLYGSTLCYRYRPLGPNRVPQHGKVRGRAIYVFWHEYIVLPCYQYARRDILVLISQHADGEMIAQVCRHVGFGTVRGSKSRGGMEALRKMIRARDNFHIAVMTDGPRGPRRHVELGLIFLAAKTGLPLVAVGVGYDRPWRLNTWDRFAVPRPWSRTVVVTHDDLLVPPDADRDTLERYRREMEDRMNAVTTVAERLAER